MKRWTEQQILSCLQQAANELDEFDTKHYTLWARSKDVPSLSTVIYKFGSWREAVQAADIKMMYRYYSDEDILTALNEAAEELDIFTSQTYREWAKIAQAPSLTLISSRFGSWSNALREAKLQTTTARNNEERIIQALIEAKDELNHFSILHYRKWAEGRNVPSTSTINALFGSWTAALRCMEEQKVMQ